MSFSLRLLRLRVLEAGGGGWGIVASSVRLPECMLSPVLYFAGLALLIRSSSFFCVFPPASCSCFAAPGWACWSPSLTLRLRRPSALYRYFLVVWEG